MPTRYITTVLAVLGVLGLWETSAHAARDFTAAQSPAPNAPVTMGTTGTLSYQITNANTGGNTGERIYEVRFRMASGLSTFSSSTAAPAGWTRISYSTTSVTFRANSWANAIATGNSLNFAIIFNFRSTTADTTERLRDIRARYTTSTGGPPFTNLGSDTDSNQGGWTLRSLSITSFQTTDLFGVPVSAVAYGTQFRLVMTIRNNSTASQTAIVSTPNPPGLVGGSLNPGAPSSTVYSPSPLNLAPGASGTITFTYTAPSGTPGTIQFTAAARNGANTATSLTAVSNVLTVSPLNANIAVAPSCLFSGDTATFTMTVTNNTGSAVSNVTPSALTRFTFNGASIGAFTGPSPASFDLAAGASNTFTWTAVVTGTVPAAGPKPSFYVRGSASANGGLVTPVATSTQEDIDEYVVSLAPATTNASSTNEELVWTVTNQGCAPIDRVSITIPSGWTYASDGYAAVDLGASVVDSWVPGSPNPVLFTAPIPGERIPLGYSGDFSLVFSAVPASAGTSDFSVTIIDTAVPPNTRVTTTQVQIDPFDTTGPNASDAVLWQEEYR